MNLFTCFGGWLCRVAWSFAIVGMLWSVAGMLLVDHPRVISNLALDGWSVEPLAVQALLSAALGIGLLMVLAVGCAPLLALSALLGFAWRTARRVLSSLGPEAWTGRTDTTVAAARARSGTAEVADE